MPDGDGLVDFAILVRGCGILTRRILSMHRESDLFKLSSPDGIRIHAGSRIPNFPYPNLASLTTSIRDLERVEPLLNWRGHKIAYEGLLGAYRALQVSIREGALAWIAIYDGWEGMSQAEFTGLLDSRDEVSGVLWMHYLALSVMMRPVLDYIGPGERKCLTDSMLAECIWGRDVYGSLSGEMRGLVEWEVRVIGM